MPKLLLEVQICKLTKLSGGRTVYFGDIGKNSQTLLDYFNSKGASPPPVDANPAEYMLEAIGAAPGVKSDIDWPTVWRESDEYKGVQTELQRLVEEPPRKTHAVDESDYAQFAAPFSDQLKYAVIRTFQQFWRSPTYINAKTLLTVGSVSLIRHHFDKTTLTLLRSHFLLAFRSGWQRTPNRACKTSRSACWSSSSSSCH